MGFSCENNLNWMELKNFDVKTLIVHSNSLKKNPLKDSPIKRNPIMIPKNNHGKKLPVVFVLAGYTGTGPKYFSYKLFEQNFPQTLDRHYSEGIAPDAIYVFVDDMTYWGGSQFINSKVMGNHEDYIVKELVPAVKEQFQSKTDSKHWCVMGGSSGGYGALHLVSKYPEIFGYAGAIAPDSFFDMSLLPEIYKSLPILEKMGGLKKVREELEAGRFFRRKDSHMLINVIAMACCYSGYTEKQLKWPINELGEVKTSEWKKWLQHDPVHFLEKRKANLKKVKGILLDVGKRDQYHLQFGSRKIRKVLKKHKVTHSYSEFDGTHWDISDRRDVVWKWLKSKWG